MGSTIQPPHYLTNPQLRPFSWQVNLTAQPDSSAPTATPSPLHTPPSAEDDFEKSLSRPQSPTPSTPTSSIYTTKSLEGPSTFTPRWPHQLRLILYSLSACLSAAVLALTMHSTYLYDISRALNINGAYGMVPAWPAHADLTSQYIYIGASATSLLVALLMLVFGVLGQRRDRTGRGAGLYEAVGVGNGLLLAGLWVAAAVFARRQRERNFMDVAFVGCRGVYTPYVGVARYGTVCDEQTAVFYTSSVEAGITLLIVLSFVPTILFMRRDSAGVPEFETVG